MSANTPAQAAAHAFVTGCASRGITASSASVPPEGQLATVRGLWADVADAASAEVQADYWRAREQVSALMRERDEARAANERLRAGLAALADQWDAQSADDRDEAAQLAAYGMGADRKATLRAAAVREAHAAALRKLVDVMTEPPAPDFRHRAYGVELDWVGEDGGIVARSHIPDLRFVAACNHLSRKDARLVNLFNDKNETLENTLSIVSRAWAVAVDPGTDEWAIRFDSQVTEQTPGSFPVTVLWP